jgi:hypothetical protein
MNEHERKRMAAYRIQKALDDAESALMFLMQQGEPLGLDHDAYVRTAYNLVVRIDEERAAARRNDFTAAPTA